MARRNKNEQLANKSNLQDTRNTVVENFLKLLKAEGSWQDVTNKHDKTAKKDLLSDIRHLLDEMLDDYEDLRSRHD